MPEKLVSLELPGPWPGANARRILHPGQWIEPIARLKTFSDEQFEVFVSQWLEGYLSTCYHEIQRRGGSGDKGRDIVAWVDGKDVKPRTWDLYQCKHYSQKLAPTEFYEELGKLCYYTFQKHYTVPRAYYVAASAGIGPKLQDLFDDANELKKQLISNWAISCSKKIVASQNIRLEGRFKRYVESFDFSIVSEKTIDQILAEHKRTKYHAYVFGVELEKRKPAQIPPKAIAEMESRYVEQIFQAFSERLGRSVSHLGDLSSENELKKFFAYARECFYSAESLREFARDSWLDESHFDDLLTQLEKGLFLTVSADHPDGYKRMRETCNKSLDIQIDSNILRDEVKTADRVGICHQLANEDRITWVKGKS